MTYMHDSIKYYDLKFYTKSMSCYIQCVWRVPACVCTQQSTFFYILDAEIRLLNAKETPLNLQLNYGSHQSFMELRLVQMRDTLSTPLHSATKSKGNQRGSRGGRGEGDSDSDDTLSNGSNPNDIVPKEEGTFSSPCTFQPSLHIH